MNNYREVLKIAKDLQDELNQKITLFESLQIAAQIHQTEVLTAVLLENSIDKPVALQAIAMVLDYEKQQLNRSILNALMNRE